MDIKEVGPYLISFLGLLITAYVAIRGRKKERAETEKLNEERGKISSETEKISAETLSTQLRALSERVDAMSMDLAAYAGYIRYLLEGIRKNTRWSFNRSGRFWGAKAPRSLVRVDTASTTVF